MTNRMITHTSSKGRHQSTIAPLKLGGIGGVEIQTRDDLVGIVRETGGRAKVERDEELEAGAACSSIGKRQLSIGPAIHPNVYFRR